VGAGGPVGPPSSWISSRPPLRRTALPPAARTLWTQCTFSPSIDTRYRCPSTTTVTNGSETIRPRLSSGHLHCHEVGGRDARRGHSRRRSIQNPRTPVGSLPTVQPSSEVAESHLSLSTFYLFMS